MFSLICARINDWVISHEAGDFRRHCTLYDVIVMLIQWRHYIEKCDFQLKGTYITRNNMAQCVDLLVIRLHMKGTYIVVERKTVIFKLVLQAVLRKKLGLYSLSGKTSYRQISWGLDSEQYRPYPVALWTGKCHGWGISNTAAIQISMKIISFNVWVSYFVWTFKGILWNAA